MKKSLSEMKPKPTSLRVNEEAFKVRCALFCCRPFHQSIVLHIQLKATFMTGSGEVSIKVYLAALSDTHSIVEITRGKVW